MEYHFLNANLYLSNLEEFVSVNKLSSRLVLLGIVDAIVDFNDLQYITDKEVIEKTTEGILSSYLDSQAHFHQLSALSGNYVVLQIDSDQLVKVITSDSIDPKFAVYYRNISSKINISNDYRLISSDLDLSQITTYDQKVLKALSKTRWGLPGRTFFHEVKKMDSRSIYSISKFNVKKEAVIYPSEYRGNISVEDYLSVVGKKLPEEKFSLAYSSGVDSHVLLDAHANKIDELCTYYFPYPNLGIEKTKATGASTIQSIQRGMTLPKLISVDECDHSGIDFLKHSATFQIYASHFALNFYRLAEDSKNDHLILGEAADAMAGFFTHTNEISLKTVWRDRKRLLWRMLDNLNFRRKINKKYFEESLQHVLSCYTDEGRLKGNIDLEALSNIWPMLLYFRSSQTITNSVATIFSAGDYFNKKIYCPYSEPLSHFAVSQWKKSFAGVFDPKIEIRKKYDYISDESILGKIERPFETVENSIFDTVSEELNTELPDLANHLKEIGINKVSNVHIACLALGGF